MEDSRIDVPTWHHLLTLLKQQVPTNDTDSAAVKSSASNDDGGGVATREPRATNRRRRRIADVATPATPVADVQFTPSNEELAEILMAMQSCIINVCGYYSKLGEKVKVLQSNGAYALNTKRTGHDIEHIETGSLVEHKSSTPGPGSKQVNAQLVFTASVRDSLHSAVTAARKSSNAHATDTTPLSRFTLLDGQTFVVPSETLLLVEGELGAKMSDTVHGCMAISASITAAPGKCATSSQFVINALAIKLEIVRWLSNQYARCCAKGRVPKTMTINIGGAQCRHCRLPHRIQRLTEQSKTLIDHLEKVAADRDVELGFILSRPIEELIAKHIDPSILSAFYEKPTCHVT